MAQFLKSWILTTSGPSFLELYARKLGQDMIVHDYDSFNLDLYEIMNDLVCNHVNKNAQSRIFLHVWENVTIHFLLVLLKL